MRHDFATILAEGEALAGLDRDPRRRVSPRPAPPPPPPAPERLADHFGALAERLFELCPLRAEPAVAEYVESRGLRVAASGGVFGALPADPARLICHLVAEFGFATWLASGLATRDGRWSWPRHRLLIGWCDLRWRLVTIQRRLIGPAPDEIPRYVFPRGRPPTLPFGAGDADECGGPGVPLIVTEGALDTLSILELARRRDVTLTAIGLPGVRWQPEWGILARGRPVYLAVDVDEAGERVISRIAADCRSFKAILVKRLTPPRACGDWNQLLSEARQ